MKRILLGIALGGFGGALFGFALGIFIYPFWFLQDRAMERLSDAATRTEVASGPFVHVNRADPIHWGKGDVSILTAPLDGAVVQLHDNFEVGPGPRFHVYLVDRADVRSGDDFLASKTVDLGRLRAFAGSQIYSVPGDAPIADFKSVVVWCKEFGVLISPATLRPAVAALEHEHRRLNTESGVSVSYAPKLSKQ